MFTVNLEEDTLYEVLVSTGTGDDFNIRAFGMRLVDGNIVLKLYPNHTLSNIKKTGTFTVHFTTDVSLFTGAVFGLLDESSLKLVDVSIVCEVISIDSSHVEDSYGKNITTTIHAKPVEIIRNRESMPTINRATNKIIELLVDYTRYDYMNICAKKQYLEKLEQTEKYIQKNGNQKHKQAINKIKKETKS